jgi:hypothetical protein
LARRKWLMWGLVALVGVFVVIQLVPYGGAHTNPPIVAEPAWDSQTTRDLAVRACFDCHSNETNWPWYTNVAPISWLTQHDVEEGRRELNFSEWGPDARHSDEAAETVDEGEMPPPYYAWVHSSARLSDAEKRQLSDGFRAMFADH